MLLLIKPDACWNLASLCLVYRNCSCPASQYACKKAWSRRIIPEDEYMKGLLTTKSDIGMWPRLSITKCINDYEFKKELEITNKN